MRNEPISKMRWALALVLMCLFVALGMGAAEAPDRRMTPLVLDSQKNAGEFPEGPNRILTPEYRKMLLLLNGATNEEEAREVVAARPLERRDANRSVLIIEQVDFLLTPALLVQEAVSDDVMLTYPEE